MWNAPGFLVRWKTQRETRSAKPNFTDFSTLPSPEAAREEPIRTNEGI